MADSDWIGLIYIRPGSILEYPNVHIDLSFSEADREDWIRGGADYCFDLQTNPLPALKSFIPKSSAPKSSIPSTSLPSDSSHPTESPIDEPSSPPAPSSEASSPTPTTSKSNPPDALRPAASDAASVDAPTSDDSGAAALKISSAIVATAQLSCT
ncbi:Uncharacterized protein Fot_14217 [Forsythia ovata]|uniref:Uncharacterized protein n=1 Tax=Forsythia ovata TaxID=205694 RepID=A0ABD1W5Q7_9LAMI